MPIHMIFEYDFMINAFLASGIIAVLAGTVGYFLVLRGQTFAGHALAHVGFSGATGAALIGLSPIWGMVYATLIAAIAMGTLGEKLAGRDLAIGLILSFSLGLGLLFLHFYTTFSSQVNGLLFGNVLSISQETLHSLFLICIISLILLLVMIRPLLFTSLQPELAEAKGISLRLIAILFLSICAFAIAASTQIVGILLIFTLLIGPAAAAQNICLRLSSGIALSIFFAITASWLGITLAYYTDWPTSFWISALSALIYLLSFVPRWLKPL